MSRRRAIPVEEMCPVVIYTYIYIYIYGSDIFINGKIVDDFNVLDKNYIYTLNVSATQQLHRSLLVDGNTNNGTDA